MTLPAGSVGDTIDLIDYAGTFDSNRVTIAANGVEKIQGSTNDITVYEKRAKSRLVYVDSTQGWLPTPDRISTGKSIAMAMVFG